LRSSRFCDEIPERLSITVFGENGMDLPDLSLGTEWAILELLCLGLTRTEDKTLFINLLEMENLHWGELLEQAIYHRVSPHLAYYITQAEFESYVHREIVWQLRLILDVNRRKTVLHRAEAVRIGQALQAKAIPYVNTKGIAFESMLYGGNYTRYFNDIDFLILPEYREEATSILHELGYEMGYYDWLKQCVMSHDRRELLIYKMSPDHVPPFAMGTDDDIIPGVKVDIANNLTWENSGYEIPLDKAFAKVIYQPVPGFSDFEMPCFVPVYQFIHTVMHLFREAWVERRWQDDSGKDVNLSKFGDVIRLWQKHSDEFLAPSFVETLKELGIIEPVLWVLEHLDRAFGLDSVAALGLVGYVEANWLYTAYNPRGELFRWRGSMRERLQSKRRKALFED
jgi:hypothetical protein